MPVQASPSFRLVEQDAQSQLGAGMGQVHEHLGCDVVLGIDSLPRQGDSGGAVHDVEPVSLGPLQDAVDAPRPAVQGQIGCPVVVVQDDDGVIEDAVAVAQLAVDAAIWRQPAGEASGEQIGDLRSVQAHDRDGGGAGRREEDGGRGTQGWWIVPWRRSAGQSGLIDAIRGPKRPLLAGF